MASIKPSIPKGTRDFSPTTMMKRTYIFDIFRKIFYKYGYQQIETPAMENLSTLTGKYGDEGEQLIFKILNSGDFLAEINPTTLAGIQVRDFVAAISEKALRYDLTIPLARYVAMHQNELVFPFKRFQIQAVWRADRPQRGRYREFYQCDIDVVGSHSLLNEVEFVLICDEVLSCLGLKDFTIKINHRKILSGVAEVIGRSKDFAAMTVAIDKLDKVGGEGVIQELRTLAFDDTAIEIIQSLLAINQYTTLQERLECLTSILQDSPLAQKGIQEVRAIFDYLQSLELKHATVDFDSTLVRGLNYYTGTVFEVKTNEVAIGSISGGGRYDNLSNLFGLENLTGVGISFGIERIYDILEQLNLFPKDEDFTKVTRVLICCFDKESEYYALPLLQKLRGYAINAEMYPADTAIGKQMKYAHKKHIDYVVIIGSEEMQTGLLTFKNMQTGQQQKLGIDQIIDSLSATPT